MPDIKIIAIVKSQTFDREAAKKIFFLMDSPLRERERARGCPLRKKGSR